MPRMTTLTVLCFLISSTFITAQNSDPPYRSTNADASQVAQSPANGSTAATSEFRDIVLGVFYVCNGERVVVNACDVNNPSDSGTCQVAYFDRPRRNGYIPVSSETRGTLRKLLATCKQPSAEELETKRKFDEGVQRRYQAEIDARNERTKNEAPANTGGASDRETLALRRCHSSGRPIGECVAEVMGGAIAGFIPPLATKKVAPGLRLSGRYEVAGFSIEFPNKSSDQLPSGKVKVGCGKLDPEIYDYTVTRSTGSINLTVMTKPMISFVLQPNGNWAGPGVVELNGRFIVGYGPPHEETVTVPGQPVMVQRNIGTPINSGDTSTYYWSFPSHMETRTVRTPIYKSGTDRCDLRNVVLVGAARDKSTISEAAGLVETPPGLRMGGDYVGGGGFSINFHPATATVNCGEAAWSDAYVVEPTGKEMLVKLKNGASPFTLVLRPDGSLVPSMPGVITVAGREMIGMNGAQPVYRPQTARCQLTSLTPQM